MQLGHPRGYLGAPANCCDCWRPQPRHGGAHPACYRKNGDVRRCGLCSTAGLAS